jgi:hypothetical protein
LDGDNGVVVIPVAAPDCTAADLRPLPAMLQGATGSMLGPVSFRNVSARRCTVGGRPRVRLVLAGRVFATRERALRPADGARSVSTVAAGGRVGIYVQWWNWCGAWANGFVIRTLHLDLTLTTGVRLSTRVRSGRARCDAPSRPSRLYVSMFRTAR